MYRTMARDMRHPYIPSTTVLGDKMLCISYNMPKRYVAGLWTRARSARGRMSVH